MDNRPVVYKPWYAKGITNVAHLMKDSTTFLSYHKFEKLFDIKSNFLPFQGLIPALKSLNRDCSLIWNKECEDFMNSSRKMKRPTK